MGAFQFALDLHDPDVRVGWWAQISLRLISWGANLRAFHCQLPYGDQGLFIRASTYGKVGGFATERLMEDYELVDRLRTFNGVTSLPPPLKKKGEWLEIFVAFIGFPTYPAVRSDPDSAHLSRVPRTIRRIEIVPTPILTSARRWVNQSSGIWFNTLRNQLIVLAWRWGVSDERLEQWYRSHRFFPWFVLDGLVGKIAGFWSEVGMLKAKLRYHPKPGEIHKL